MLPRSLPRLPAITAPLGAVMAALIAGCSSSAAPPAPGGPAEVGVVTLEARPVTLSAELPGRTVSTVVAEVRPQVGGILRERLFTEGADVKAGQLLYRIDPAPYQAAVDSARATLAKARANVDSLRPKAARYTELAEIKAVAQQDTDDALAALRQAEAEVDAARAALDSATINLAYTRVTAPVAGRIGKSAVTPGALVTAGQATALATVQQVDPIYVDLTQSSADALRLRRAFEAGQLRQAGRNQAAVSLILEDGSRYGHEGRLQFTDITVNEGTGTVALRAVFPNPRGELLPGMYVRAALQEGVAEQAVLVPQRGVSRNVKGEATALVVGADNSVEQRVLRVSRPIGDSWLVEAGLAAGERVIVEGSQKVRPKAVVKPVAVDSKVAARPAAASPAPGV
ncbi:efflux RND transporter periplasmic adaptor subunit [Zoogloea sp.]|uniref:efflux RND transporter periplasmic adaptor subunit n=1 Tax=Zoogloea sp. TaxID=49181 RepID=UPI0025EA2723|nr:efflux RND transporter periplasmic adaptor subunit [Zoogloea sp.]MCK6396419.1 efflux RND transporter periplasmic adaptor subunit [Zoogloea sp.]